MSQRYIFNTSGEYVAFITGPYLFSPDCEWLGVITNGNEVFNPEGLYIGYLLEDDRIARDTRQYRVKRIPRSIRPMRPLRPLRPLRRLRMPRLPRPLEDIFEGGPAHKLYPAHQLPSFDHLLGAQIVASDGTLLGVINTNAHDTKSISNKYGPHGSKYNQASILNQYGPYGGKYSPMSPFNQYSASPPRIVKNNQVVAHLTKSPYQPNRIDPDELVAWLKLEG